MQLKCQATKRKFLFLVPNLENGETLDSDLVSSIREYAKIKANKLNEVEDFELEDTPLMVFDLTEGLFMSLQANITLMNVTLFIKFAVRTENWTYNSPLINRDKYQALVVSFTQFKQLIEHTSNSTVNDIKNKAEYINNAEADLNLMQGMIKSFDSVFIEKAVKAYEKEDETTVFD